MIAEKEKTMQHRILGSFGVWFYMQQLPRLTAPIPQLSPQSLQFTKLLSQLSTFSCLGVVYYCTFVKGFTQTSLNCSRP